jgi:hypothetical protein
VRLTEALVAAVAVEPRRRDRELVLAKIAARLRGDSTILWPRVREAETRRRAGYLVDAARRASGQLPAEAAALAAVRDGMPARPPRPFWPGERPLPPGTDPVAECWGFSRGVDLLRLRAGMEGRAELLPDATAGRPQAASWVSASSWTSTGPLSLPLASTSRSTSSITAIGALSPVRKPALSTRM